MTRVAADPLAGDAHLLVAAASPARRRHRSSAIVLHRRSHCRWLSARSKASKLRQRRAGQRRGTTRLAISGTRCSEMPPCERSGASSPDRSCRARRRAEHREPLGDDDEIADAIRRQLEAGAGRRARAARLDAGQRGKPRADVGDVRAGGQIDGRERAQRAVMHDVRIGDRQDHARCVLRRTTRRARPAERRCCGRPKASVLAFMPWSAVSDDRRAERVELRQVAVHHRVERRWPPACRARACAARNRSSTGT